MTELGYVCRCCGERHKGMPFSYGPEAPARWHDEPAATDHPMAVQQRTGITLSRVQEFAELLLHLDARPAAAQPAQRWGAPRR